MQQAAVTNTPIAVGERVGLAYHVRGVVDADEDSLVYEASDLLLQRAVLLKVTDRQHRAMMVREAQVLARVRHPCVPAVYGVGVHRGFAYIASEQIQGVTVAELLEAGASEVDEVVPLLAGLAEALDVVHAHQLAHGALCTRSVLICPNDRVVLRGLGPATTTAKAADIRAFGEIAHQLLTGQAPGPNGVDLAAMRGEAPLALVDVIQGCLVGSPRLGAIATRLRAIPKRAPRASSPRLR